VRTDATAPPPEPDDPAPNRVRGVLAPLGKPHMEPIDSPKSGWSSLPDRLTRFRLGIVPLLWILALLGVTTWLGVGLAVAAFTDVVDGPIARHYHRTTSRGSRLDSIADHTLTASTGLWLVWLRPEFVAEQLPLLSAWAALGLTALLVGWLRFRKVGDLHLYSAKAAGTLGYLFAIWLLLFGSYSATVFYLVIALCMLASLETLLVVSTRSRVDEHIGSILRSSRRDAPGNR